MHQLLTPPQEIRTARLLLAPTTPADIDALLPLFGSRADAEHAVQDAVGSRVRHGLGPWVVRTIDGGRLVGFGGAFPDGSGGWTIGVRLVAAFGGTDVDAEVAPEIEHAAQDAVAALR